MTVSQEYGCYFFFQHPKTCAFTYLIPVTCWRADKKKKEKNPAQPRPCFRFALRIKAVLHASFIHSPAPEYSITSGVSETLHLMISAADCVTSHNLVIVTM